MQVLLRMKSLLPADARLWREDFHFENATAAVIAAVAFLLYNVMDNLTREHFFGIIYVLFLFGGII